MFYLCMRLPAARWETLFSLLLASVAQAEGPKEKINNTFMLPARGLEPHPSPQHGSSAWRLLTPLVATFLNGLSSCQLENDLLNIGDNVPMSPAITQSRMVSFNSVSPIHCFPQTMSNYLHNKQFGPGQK